jgi:O-antigen ligase
LPKKSQALHLKSSYHQTMVPSLVVLLAVCATFCVLGLTILFPNAAAIIWILALETSPDDWLDHLAGGAQHETIIGLMKAFGLILAATLMLRFGARRDRYNPGFAFAAMFVTGLLHGLYPGLTLLSSLRSLIGSAGPFLFSFARLPADFCRAVIWAALWGPLCTIGFGAVLAACGLDHMYVLEQGALRLGASGEPPFLAGFALIGIYAGLAEFTAAPRRGVAAALGINLTIILLTGARAPLAIACCEVFALLILQRRILLLAGAGAVAAGAFLFSGWLGFIRVIDLTRLGEAADLSNRGIVWPHFERAFLASPLFGWGIGAGKFIIPVTSQIDALLGTNAAHNEYLRIGTEGGVLGLALLVILITLWVRRGSAPMAPAQRSMVRLIFIGFAVHSATDNTMIATTSSVFFLWASCIFARAANAATPAA